MNQAHTEQPGAGHFPAMADDCRELRLALWYVDAQTSGVIEPADVGPGGQWLRSASQRDQIEHHAKGWLSEAQPKPCQIQPGCWAFPALALRNRRVTAVIVGVTLEASAFDQPWFGASCREAGVDPASARSGLATYTGPGKADVPLLSAALRQIERDHAQTDLDAVAIDQFSEQLLDSYEQTNLLFRLARAMNGLDNPEDLIPTCCNQMLPVLPFKWIAVKFWDNARDLKGLTNRLVVAGDLPCTTETFHGAVTEQFGGRRQQDWTRLLDPSSGGVPELVGSEVVVDQIIHDDEVVGVLLAGNKVGNSPMESDVSSGEMLFLEATSNLMGVFHENIARFTEQRELFTGTVRALTSSIDAKDEYTRGHSERVAYLGARLAQALGLDAQIVEQVHTAGLVHDVGKIGIPEDVLRKTGRLTDEEFGQIKRHPGIGYEILKGIPAMKPMLPGVLYHHERWDGNGYPEKLKGEGIPLIGRILACADTFDAMSSTRSYRPALPHQAVLDEITRCAGTQFDPRLAPLFVTLNFDGYDQMVQEHQALSGFAA